MAQFDRIRDALRHQPFQPFTIKMADSTTCVVRHPDWIAIPPIRRPREVAFFAVPEDGGDDEFHTHWLNLALVSEVNVSGMAEMPSASQGIDEGGDQ